MPDKLVPRNSSSHPLPHLLRRIFGVGNGKDFVGPGIALRTRLAMRLVRTVVFPVPAPAMTSRGPWTCSIACAGIRPVGTHADLGLILRLPLFTRIPEKHEEFSEEILLQFRKNHGRCCDGSGLGSQDCGP